MLLATAAGLSACQGTPTESAAAQAITHTPVLQGTNEPFSAEAIYFIMTDRFVDGDPTNNYETQGLSLIHI